MDPRLAAGFVAAGIALVVELAVGAMLVMS